MSKLVDLSDSQCFVLLLMDQAIPSTWFDIKVYLYRHLWINVNKNGLERDVIYIY